MIGVAVIGVGHWGPNLLRHFDNSGESQIRRVIDLDQGRLNEVKQRLPHAITGHSIEAALEDPKVNAVVIATPPSTHYQMVKDSLECGKHVLVEKPITKSSREAYELAAIADSHDLTLMVGHEFVFNPAVRYIKQCLEAERLGRIMRISMVRTNLGQVRTDVDAAWDLMPHDLSMLLYWLDTMPTAVTAHGESWMNQGICDAVQATLIFPGPVVANIQVSWLDPIKDRQVRIVGDNQMLTFDDLAIDGRPVNIHDIGINDPEPEPGFVTDLGQFRRSFRGGDIISPVIGYAEPLAAECDHFLECIRTRRQPETSSAHAYDVIRILEAIDRSRLNHSALEVICA